MKLAAVRARYFGYAGIVLGVAAVAASAQERRVVTGVVVDPSDHPIPSARIQIAGKPSTVADDSGRFRIELPHRDKVALDVTRIGFMPSRFGIGEGGDTSVNVLLLPAAQELAKVNVTSTPTDLALARSGFAQRLREREQGSNSGIFITAADIEKRNASRITYMFEDLPGVTVCRKSTIETCGLFGNHLIPNPSGKGLVKCPITVYLDGQRLNSLKNTNDSVDIDSFVLPLDVAGIEYYASGNRIPAQFQLLNGSCGAAIVWTKRG